MRPWSKIPLDEIQAVKTLPFWRGLWGSFPGMGAFSVTLKDGRELKIQTFGAGRWRKELFDRSRRLAG